MTTNPLLRPSPLPNHAPAFDKITEADYVPAVEAAIADARANIAQIKNNSAPADFDNTIVALETASETLGLVTSVFYNQLSVMGGDKLQALAEKIGPVSANFSADIMHDKDLFARVKAVRDAGTDGLTPEQTMLLDDTYKGFVRSGALLDPAKKQRLREISERMSVLSPQFSNNVTKSAEAFELLIEDEADLSGLPASAIAGAAHAAEEKGHAGRWLFTLDVPSYAPFMQFADRRDLREKLWRAFSNRAYGDAYDNCATLLEIVRLRHERAQLLGYQTHAHFVLEERMAERPETVEDFLRTLQETYKPAAEDDLVRLKDFAKTQGHDGDLKPWDVGYYSEKLRQSLFDFSDEDLRPYFPLTAVLEGVFAHFSALFHLRFAPAGDKYPVWHPDVKAFEVFDLTDESFLGTLYADFHPRTGKRGGAWKTSYRNAGLFRGKNERPLVSIVCNFTKPTKDKPSLLTHNEVLTLFHEMGHAMHALLARGTYPSQSGTNVLWDFVELPSQLQENWAYEKACLDRFARHYETGEAIPAALIRKIQDAKNFMAGWGGLRQTSFAALDMAWHTQDPTKITDPAAFEDAEITAFALFPRLGGPQSAAFSHIFAGGYAAGYYSYKWAEVLDADAFELFQERGLYDRPTAESYKNEILAKGGSEHPRILYRRFRGRDADPNALFRRENLKNVS
ncbi:MAG: M3 family metallopeptidase [Alphaproteobacteria bacterium]|nr:M3 family metallopeptidase [Alphaproteobacteria bacterium]